MLRLSALLLVALFPFGVYGQGTVGPSPFSIPSNINPAFSSLIPGKASANFSHRIRRVSDSENFNSTYFSLDYPVQFKGVTGGLGLQVQQEKAGGLAINQAHALITWEAPLGRRVRYHHLRAGVAAGIIQMNVNLNDIVLFDQYNQITGAFTSPLSDPLLLASDGSSPIKFDLSLGLLFYRTQKIKGNPELNYFLGAAMHRITQPTLSLAGAGEGPRLSENYIVTGGVRYRTRSSLDYNMYSIFRRENNSSELISSIYLRAIIYQNAVLFVGKQGAVIYAGVNVRQQLNQVDFAPGAVEDPGIESISPFFGLELQNAFIFGIAFETIVADNTALSNTYGGLQISVKYLLGGKDYSRPALPVPLF